jgi:hypothetical protein
VAVRVRLRVRSRSTERELKTSALVNSGFETFKLQLLVPVRFAMVLGLWPHIPRDYAIRDCMTTGGLTRMYVLID